MKPIRSNHSGGPLSNHRVVLLPGFLGFDTLGDFSYFQERVGQTIVDSLAAENLHVDLYPLKTVPAGTLAERQTRLVEQLQEILRDHPNTRLHLVGHSTGGLDAELLIRAKRPPQHDNTASVRSAVASVVTLAAPLAGTALARSALARAFAGRTKFSLPPLPHWRLLFSSKQRRLMQLRSLSAVLASAANLVQSVHTDEALLKLIRGFLCSREAGQEYIVSLIMTRALIRDLQPKQVEQYLSQTEADPKLAHIRRTRFVTVARHVSDESQSGELFNLLYRTTADESAPSPTTSNALARLQVDQIPWIGSGAPPRLDHQTNDGIVNTLRQLLPVPVGELDAELARVAAFVIADHIDVIGYFPDANNTPIGFLHSGSDFREKQFIELYKSIAAELAKSMRD